MPDDGVTEIPVSPVGSSDSKGVNGMNDQDYGMLKLRAHNSAAVAAEGAAAYAENLRYDYLEGKHNPSISEGLGYRVVTESGAGRTRAETNAPHTTGAGG